MMMGLLIFGLLSTGFACGVLFMVATQEPKKPKECALGLPFDHPGCIARDGREQREGT